MLATQKGYSETVKLITDNGVNINNKKEMVIHH